MSAWRASRIAPSASSPTSAGSRRKRHRQGLWRRPHLPDRSQSSVKRNGMLSDQLDGQERRPVDSVSLAEAKARLSELVARAAEGETVQITRRGEPVAQIAPIRAPRK